MPEHSETTHIPPTNGSTLRFTGPLLGVNGRRIVAAFAENRLRPNDTWIVTTITDEGFPEAWRVQEIKDATP